MTRPPLVLGPNAIQPTLAWLGALALSVAAGVLMSTPTFSFALWWNTISIVAIPAALWGLLGVWFSRRLNLFRPVPDVLGAVLLAVLLASSWAPLQIVLASGFIGGLAYWIFAGLPRPTLR